MSKETREQNQSEEISELDKLIPKMNVSIPAERQQGGDISALVSDEQLMSIYAEIIDGLRKDKEEVDNYVATFADMVINEGDATTSSKETFVKLVELKTTNIPDKMIKVADLMTRLKMKEKDTFPKYLAAHQNNTINIGEGNSKRALLEEIEKKKNKKDSK